MDEARILPDQRPSVGGARILAARRVRQEHKAFEQGDACVTLGLRQGAVLDLA